MTEQEGGFGVYWGDWGNCHLLSFNTLRPQPSQVSKTIPVEFILPFSGLSLAALRENIDVPGDTEADLVVGPIHKADLM